MFLSNNILIFVLTGFEMVAGYHNPCTAMFRQADMALPYFQQAKVSLPQKKTARSKRSVTSDPERIWKNGVIPYEIMDTFYGLLAFPISKGKKPWELGKEKVIIHQAILHWELMTCLTFVPKSTETEYIVFQNTGDCGCCSYVGKMGNGQAQGVNLATECITYATVLHEIGHVIGYWHEHTRPDRDTYLKILTRNIIKGELKNFIKKKSSEIDSLGVRYDYGSIMHYGKRTFSKNSYDNTILPKKKEKNDPTIHIGQRETLSDLDVLQANLLYKCPHCSKTYIKSTGVIEHYLSRNATGIHECYWRIMASVGQTIYLQFNYLNFQLSCKKAYLEIWDGKHADSRLLGRYCRNKKPPLTIISLSENLYMKFFYKKKWSYSGQKAIGLKATYRVLCGKFLNLDSGFINSPNYPNEYANNEVCEWNIQVSENHKIAFDFKFLKVEKSRDCARDYVEIIDSAAGKSLGRFCRTRDLKDLVTSSNIATVRFRTDEMKVKLGFSLRYFTEIDECSINNGNCSHECTNLIGGFKCSCRPGYQLHSDGRSCEVDCVQTINIVPGQTGFITSPSYPDNYPDNRQCKWKLIGLIGYEIVLKVKVLDLANAQVCNDHVEVFEGRGPEERLLKTLCGSLSAPVFLTTERRQMTITFKSDNTNSRSGFLGEIRLDKNECYIQNGGCQHNCKNLPITKSYQCSCNFGYQLKDDKRHCFPGNCSAVAREREGWIASPDFPAIYPGQEGCEWLLKTIPGQKFVIKFLSGVKEWRDLHQCPMTLLTLLNNRWTSKENICSLFQNKNQIESASHLLRVKFHPKFHNSHFKFNFTYQSACGGELLATKEFQSIYSHINYLQGEKYPAKQNCSWLITTRGRRRKIMLQFKFFHLENNPCTFDYVSIYDGKTTRSPLIAKLCGSKLTETVFQSSGNSILIRFFSDHNVHMKGFELQYKRIRANSIPVKKKEDSKDTTNEYGRRRDFFVFDFDDS